MSGYLILVIIIALIAIIALFYVNSLTTLKKYKDKMTNAETIIEENLEKKLKSIISINGSIKKVTGKKDYLKDYTDTNEMIISSFEKDMKLDEAVKLINNLMNDFNDLSKDTEFNKNYKNLREIDETLTAAKNLFNKNAILSNGLIKSFPYNIVAKISKIKMRSYYNNNKTDDSEF